MDCSLEDNWHQIHLGGIVLLLRTKYTKFLTTDAASKEEHLHQGAAEGVHIVRTDCDGVSTRSRDL